MPLNFEREQGSCNLRPDDPGLAFSRNHKAASQLFDRFSPKNVFNRHDQISTTWRVKTNQKNASVCSRSKVAYIRKIEVLSDQKSGFGLCGCPDRPIIFTFQTFVDGSVNVMAEVLKKFCHNFGEVFVQLDFHRTSGIAGIGKSSSAEAAAKAIAARISSGVRLGKAASMLSGVSPSAKLANTVRSVTRVPWKTASPLQIWRSRTIRPFRCPSIQINYKTQGAVLTPPLPSPRLSPPSPSR